jgi:hypothetical protein
MRKALLLLSSALLLAGPALADDVPAPRFLTDPAYLPLSGQIHGTTSFDVGDAHGSTYDSAGVLASKFYDQTERISQQLQYGITDDLSLNLGMSYLPFDKRSRTFTAGGFSTREQDGFTDPNIGLTWRAVEQGSRSPLNVDVFGTYSPDWIDARAATATASGSEGRGGQAETLGLAVSQVLPHITVYGSAAAEFVGKRDTFDPATASTIQTGGTMRWKLAFDTQTRLDDTWSFNAGVGEDIGRDNVHVIGATGVDHANDPATATDLHVAANYAFTPQLVSSLSYAHTFDGTSEVNYPAAPASNTTTRGHQENLLGVHLNYVFK